MSGQPSENPKYKLRYFNVTALGEPLRFLFAYGGIEYEDLRVDFADWPALKPSKSIHLDLIHLSQTSWTFDHLLNEYKNLFTFFAG